MGFITELMSVLDALYLVASVLMSILAQSTLIVITIYLASIKVNLVALIASILVYNVVVKPLVTVINFF